MLQNKMKFLRFVCLCSLICSVPVDVFGWLSTSITSGYNWTQAGFQWCKGENIGDACVGNSAMSGGKCIGWASNMSNRGTESDEGATLLFIARDVRANGAKFCLTQVQGANRNRNRGVEGPWLVYYAAANSQSKCFWLCKPGYGGSECSEAASGSVCYPEEISREAFSNYKIATSSTYNVEDTSWMISRWRRGCNAHGYDEHEAFIAISGWLPSKHGAKVAPMVAWADRSGWKDMDSTAIIWNAADSLIMCAPGYKPNPSNTDCEVVDATACLLQNGTFCSGFSRDKFDATIHTLDTSGTGNCLRYFCTDSNKAFPSLGSTACEDCAKGVKGGPNKDNGVCVRCETGQYFDSATSECKTAKGFSKKALQYGETEKKAVKADDNCWMKTDPDEYKCCVSKDTCVEQTNSNSSGNTAGNTLNDLRSWKATFKRDDIYVAEKVSASYAEK